MPEPSFYIRPFAAADYANWKRLWEAYLRFYQASLAESVTRHTWDMLLDASSAVLGFGAFDNEQLLGMVHGVLHRSTWLLQLDCYLEDLYVDECARGRGIGRALIETLSAQARGRGAERVHLLTHYSNQDAQALYDRLGQQSGLIQYRLHTQQEPA